MESEQNASSGFANKVAKVLNAGGSATVWVYDKAFDTVGKVFETAKKFNIVGEKGKEVLQKGFTLVNRGEDSQIGKKIKEYEKQVKLLYFEIGKEGAKMKDSEAPLESEAVKKLLEDVKEHEKEIDRLKNRAVELKEERVARQIRKRELRKEAKFAKLKERSIKSRASIDHVNKIVENSINKAVKTGDFESRSEEEIFFKVAHDLLDSEIEIKCLAAAELGKMGNDSAVPILMDAVRYDDADLTSEIINSLIAIGDKQAIPLFIKESTAPKFRIRIGCLRGLFKLADDDVSLPVLINALKDDHPEVRRTALTFIGWKDNEDAVPSVIQCLIDEEARVRKSAVSTLANLKDEASVLPLIKVLGDVDLEIREKALEALRNITGENIEFDTQVVGKKQKEAVAELKEWWQKERLGMTADDIVNAESETFEPVDEIADADVESYAAEAVAAVETEEVEDAVESDEAVEAEPAETDGTIETEAVETEEVEDAVESDEAVEAEPAETDGTIETEAVETDEVAEAVDTEEVEDAVETDETEDAMDGQETDNDELTETKMKRMTKSELLVLCNEKGLVCSEDNTKAEMIEIILGE